MLRVILGQINKDTLESNIRIHDLNPMDSNSSWNLMVMYEMRGNVNAAIEEYKRGKEIFKEWPAGDYNALVVYLGSGDVKEAKALLRNLNSIPLYRAALEHFDEPETALMELRDFYSDEAYSDFISKLTISTFAAYFDDQDLALKAMIDSVNEFPLELFAVWRPVFKDMRRLDGFKNLLRSSGVVAYWLKYGWPTYCKPAGDDDFECE